MSRRTVPLAVTFVVVAAIAAALLLRAAAAPVSAELELLPVNPGGPVGLARFEESNERVRGEVVVWGLGPGSRHRVELRGPGACRPEREQTPRTALTLPELVADPNGVAFARVDAPARENVLRRDHYLMVYSGPGPPQTNARVSCGDLFGGDKLEPGDLALVGPGAGARAEASTILQLRDGRPIGDPQLIESRLGLGSPLPSVPIGPMSSRSKVSG